jgi:dTMP kinase
VLIAIEGIDGAGKTTNAHFLKEELEKRGFKAVVLKEPTNSEWGKKIRESVNNRLSPEEELELFILDRKHDVEHNIIPALNEGKIVIMDRYYYSNIAYQGARGLNVGEIKKRNEEIAPKPDLVILLDVNPEKGVERIKNRGDHPNKFEDLKYLQKVREIFLSIKDDNIVLVNANRELDEVKREVLNIVLNILQPR